MFFNSSNVMGEGKNKQKKPTPKLQAIQSFSQAQVQKQYRCHGKGLASTNSARVKFATCNFLPVLYTLHHTCSRTQRISQVLTLIQNHRDTNYSDVPESVNTLKIQRVEEATQTSCGTLNLAMTMIAHIAST